ncbi:MAG: substrate-binding periplasmic protein [Bacillota bacterium]
MKYHNRVSISLIIFLLFIMIINISLLAATENTNDYPSDIQRIIDRGKLIFGLYYEDMPPFFMTDDEGELYGVDIDLARSIAEEFGVDIEFNREAKSYQELFEKVVNEEVDVVIAKFSKTFNRAKQINYTEPYVTFRWALMVNSEYATSKNITEYPMTYLKKADGIKVGVKEATSYVEFAKDLFPLADVVQFETWQGAIKALREGQVNAAMYDENEVIKSLYKDPDIALFSSIYILKDKKDFISMAVPRESEQLLFWLNYYIDNYSIDYSVDDLLNKYPDIYK